MNGENESHLKSIVLSLGGLHTEMSYIGTIGHLMQNTCLNEVFKIVYGGNTVRQMICGNTGKAVAQARRGHFLLDAALNILPLSDVLQLPLPISLNECSTIAKDTDTSFDPEDIPTGNVMLETETDVTQEEHSDSSSTINTGSEIKIKAKQSLDKLDTDLEAAILHINPKLIQLKIKNNVAGRVVYGSRT